MKKAALKGINSESNGCLMRLIPLAVWCRNLKELDIIDCIYSECELTHANPKCKIINLCYALLVKFIFENETREKSFEKMKNFIFDSNNYKAIFELSCQNTDFKPSEIKDDITLWFDLISSPDKFDRKNIGHIKSAFILSMYIYLQNQNYEDSLKMMLKFGGDTDTNSAILGGLIGSNVGESKIPSDFINKVLNCDPSHKTKGPVRDKFLIPKYKVEDVINNLINYAPNKL